MINLNWVTNPVVMYSAVAAMGLACLRLAVAGKLELAREKQQFDSQLEGLQSAINALQKTVEELQADARERSVPAAYNAPQSLNLQKRSDALRMYRRGSDSSTISAALGMPQAQVALLEKVHRILDSQAIAQN